LDSMMCEVLKGLFGSMVWDETWQLWMIWYFFIENCEHSSNAYSSYCMEVYIYLVGGASWV